MGDATGCRNSHSLKKLEIQSEEEMTLREGLLWQFNILKISTWRKFRRATWGILWCAIRGYHLWHGGGIRDFRCLMCGEGYKDGMPRPSAKVYFGSSEKASPRKPWRRPRESTSPSTGVNLEKFFVRRRTH